MIKKIILTILVSAAMFLTGCGEKKVLVGDIQSTACYENIYASTGASTVRCDNGYYTLRESQGNYIGYVSDNDLGNEIFLCGKPDCRHMDATTRTILPDCDSYLGEVVFDSIRCYDGQLYVLLIENAEAVLYRISKDGSIHERLLSIGEISSNQSKTYHYIVDGENVYVLYSGEGYKEDEVNVISRFSIETGKKEILIEEKASCSVIMLYNGGLFYRKSDYQDLNSNIIRRFDLNTGEAVDVVKGSLGRYTIDNVGNRLLYWRIDKGLVSYNLGTGEEKLLRKSDDDFVRVNLACNGRYVCVDNFLTIATSEDYNIPHVVDIIEVESGEVVSTLDMNLNGAISSLCSIDNERIVGTGHFEGKYAILEISDLKAGKISWKQFGSARADIVDKE